VRFDDMINDHQGGGFLGEKDVSRRFFIVFSSAKNIRLESLTLPAKQFAPPGT
jgi:hypothetical protein